MRTFSRTLGRTGVLQVDSVNVLQRAHYMPLYSRMGPYDVDLLRRASQTRPAPDGGVLGARAGVHAGRSLAGDATPDGALPRRQAQVVGQRGHRGAHRAACSPRSPTVGPRPRATSMTGCPATKVHWGWNWSEPRRRALDYLFMVGDVAIAGRNQPVRGPLRPARAGDPARASRGAHAQRARRRQGAGPPSRRLPRGRHASATCADYYRLRSVPGQSQTGAAPGSAELVEEGELLPVTVEGVEAAGVPASRRTHCPRRIGARALLSPFDPVVWERERTELAVRLPLPDRDLRPRAQAGARLLRAALPARRPDRRRASTSRPTARTGLLWSRQLRRAVRARRTPPRSWRPSCERLAGWLGLDTVVVEPRGDLARVLSVAVAAR